MYSPAVSPWPPVACSAIPQLFSSALLLCDFRHFAASRRIANEQGAEYHELRRDEAREYRRRRDRPHEREDHSERQDRQDDLADLAEPCGAHQRIDGPVRLQ